MKRKLQITKRRFPTALMLAFQMLAGLLCSCSSLIDEDLSDCQYGTGIRFEYLIYDDNGGAANAFHSSVDIVNLYIFDGNGNYVATKSEGGNALKDPLWRMSLDLAPGKYRIVAWAGLNGESFNAPQNCNNITDASVELKRDGNISRKDLHPLWHGEAEIVVEKDYTEHLVSLIKDTRRIRIVLQQISGEPVNVDDFDFSITDDNSYLGYDNTPIPNGTTTYIPYTQGNQDVTESGSGTAATSVAYAELSTSRLFAGNRPRLKINRNADDVQIVDIPLLEYLLLIRSEGSTLTDQQFFDRKDAYTLVFFLDKKLDWLKTQIIINGWVIRLNETEMGI